MKVDAAPEGIRIGCERLLEKIWGPAKDCIAVFQNAVKAIEQVPVADAREHRTKPFTDRLLGAMSRSQKSRTNAKGGSPPASSVRATPKKKTGATKQAKRQ
jgi:hypothetical protein